LQAGENPKVVSERLGHASITLTLDVYSYMLPNMQKAAAEKLENLLFSDVGAPSRRTQRCIALKRGLINGCQPALNGVSASLVALLQISRSGID
jgi:hypothetical protein